MSQEFKMADEVLYRIVQIVQESMILGVDCTDLFRQIRLVTQDTEVVLSEQYKSQVTDMHNKWLENAVKLQEEQAVQDASQNSSENTPKLIFN